MMRAGFVDLQEVPRSNDRAPGTPPPLLLLLLLLPTTGSPRLFSCWLDSVVVLIF